MVTSPGRQIRLWFRRSSGSTSKQTHTTRSCYSEVEVVALDTIFSDISQKYVSVDINTDLKKPSSDNVPSHLKSRCTGLRQRLTSCSKEIV